jgi:hypothetical protein
MKTWEAIFAVGLAFGVGMTATAQPPAGAGADAQANAIAARYMTSVDTELTGKLDSKNAAVGQGVTAKTTQAAKLADGTALPKGTKLVGHVTRVQASNKDQPYAVLAMIFDRAELKSGQSIALRCVVRTVAPPVSVAAGPADPTAMGMGAGGGMTLGGAGGVPGGTARGGGQAGGGIGQTAGSTIGGATRNAQSAAEAAADAAGGAVTQAGETVSTAPRATGLSGVVLAASATADVSGTLMASGRNISLESGTQMTLGVIAR